MPYERDSDDPADKQKIFYVMQYRILKQKRRGYYFTKWLFIQFYLISYLETIALLNKIPGFQKNLFTIINSPLCELNEA